ncbi:MAG TPA: hypothetical protein VHD81_06300 [Mycobacteriales bacterium]|nr:hypothetical protein [Mycobacteriales bacterium]
MKRVLEAHRGIPLLALCAIGAGLSVASGAIHVHLWNIAYRDVKQGHLNVLFMVQAIACFAAAAAVLAMRNILATVGNAVLLLGTYAGYLITRYHGWFGFDPGKGIDTSWAKWAMVTELAGAVVLIVAAVAMARSDSTSAPAGLAAPVTT